MMSYAIQPNLFQVSLMSIFRPNILIVDDQIQTAETIQEITEALKYKSSIVIKSTNVISHLNNNSNINLVLLDVSMPTINGEEIQDKINNMFPHIGIITLTTSNELQKAIYSIKNGAFNYLLKPINKQKLSLAIISYIANNNLPSITKINYLNHITNEVIFKDIYHDIHVLGYKHELITILGEPGTGKKLIAKIIHSSSTSKFGPLQIIDLKSELNFEEILKLSNSGTFALEGFEELTPQKQEDIINYIDTRKKGDPPNLLFCIDSIKYKKQLNNSNESVFERILKNKIILPPLRERRNDIKLLSQYFLIKYTSQYERYISNFQEEAIEIIKNYAFPENITELDKIISSAVLVERSNEICASSLPYHIKNNVSIEDQFEKIKYKAILKTLNDTQGNKTKASKKLGMAKSTLNKLLKEYQNNN
ncbi:MAG: hypothetical protein COA79_06445 [Planctomycetota bacterium]|nr:MAG: hypothetical protein COA79_06445 [Planctomycetota bacterium]